MKVTAFDVRLNIADTPHYVEGGILHLQSGGQEAARLTLVPVIDGEAVEVSSWDQSEKGVCGRIRGGGSIHICKEGKNLAYWVEGSREHINSFTYFAGSPLEATEYRGFVPDSGNTVHGITEDANLVISSHADPSMRATRKPSKDPMVPAPRDVAFHSGDNWWGISIPGALPLGEAQVHLRRGKLSITMCHYQASNAHGNLPKAYFATDLDDPLDILSVDVDICRERKEVGGSRTYQQWWSRPVFCTWGEQQQRQPKGAGSAALPLTAQDVRTWVDYLRQSTGASDFTVAIDVPWFDHYGDFWASVRRFGATEGMRALIDELHEAGHRVILWFAPHLLDFDSDTAITQPDCILLDENGVRVEWRNGTGFRDFTSAVARNTLINNIRYMLSDDDNCLNADGLKVDLPYPNPDAKAGHLRNTRWGVGDEQWTNIMRHIHEDAHRFKHDCMVTTSAFAPHLAKYVDSLCLGHILDDDIDKWYGRAQLALKLMPGVLLGSDGWMMSLKRYPEYWTTAPVFGIPQLYNVTAFNRKERIQEGDYRRLSAMWRVYNNAPSDPATEVTVDPVEGLFFRKYSRGPLEGAYAAINFGRRCFATFSESLACVMSMEDIDIMLPVPREPKSVRALRHDGKRETQKLLTENGKVCLHIPDAGTDVMCIEVEY